MFNFWVFAPKLVKNCHFMVLILGNFRSKSRFLAFKDIIFDTFYNLKFKNIIEFWDKNEDFEQCAGNDNF